MEGMEVIETVEIYVEPPSVVSDGEENVSTYKSIEVRKPEENVEKEVECMYRSEEEMPESVDIIMTHVDEVIDEVVRKSLAFVTNCKDQDAHRDEASKSKGRKLFKRSDGLSLPFSYAGQTLNAQSQKLILNTLHFLKEHNSDEVMKSTKSAQDKAAKVLNISPSVIAKLRKNWKTGKLEQPGKKRSMKKPILDSVSPYEERTIRQIIRDHQKDGARPTISTILPLVRSKLNFSGSKTSFRRILTRMGYRYEKINKKLILIDTCPVLEGDNRLPKTRITVLPVPRSGIQTNNFQKSDSLITAGDSIKMPNQRRNIPCFHEEETLDGNLGNEITLKLDVKQDEEGEEESFSEAHAAGEMIILEEKRVGNPTGRVEFDLDEHPTGINSGAKVFFRLVEPEVTYSESELG